MFHFFFKKNLKCAAKGHAKPESCASITQFFQNEIVVLACGRKEGGHTRAEMLPRYSLPT